jgi:hypothetical protein
VRRVWLLILLCGVIYNANGQLIASGDTLPARLIPFSILLDGTLTLDRFFAAEVGGATRLARAEPEERMRHYFLTPRNGHLYSTYPVATPVLITPLYAPLVWGRGSWTTAEVLRIAPVAEKLTASLIAALSVAAMYLLLASLTTPGAALALALVFAFATTTWTTSSQALWQHGPGILFLLLALVSIAQRPDLAWRAGLCAGLAVACRPSNLFFVAALVGVIGWKRSVRDAAALAVASGGIIVLLAAYNLSAFGSPLGAYGQVDDAFHGSFPEGLLGILISPSRGLLVFSPVLIAGFVGLYRVCRHPTAAHSPVYLTAALFLASQLIFFGWWEAWWGGWSYGPRLLTEAAAMLVVLSVPAADRWGASRGARAVFGVLLAYSVAVQALGALAYDASDWNGTPVSVDQDPGRLWEWRDSQIRRTAVRFARGDWIAGCGNVLRWLTDRCDATATAAIGLPGAEGRAQSGRIPRSGQATLASRVDRAAQ